MKKITLNDLQKLRMVQAFFAFVMTMLSFTLVGTFSLPRPPAPENFLTASALLKYNLLQVIFLLSFISAAGLLGMAYQAKDVSEEN